MAAFKESKISITNAIGCVPGTDSITGKASLFAALRAAYGARAASRIAPATFVLPYDYHKLASYVQATGGAGSWVLKQDSHRGKGITAVNGPSVLWRALGAPSMYSRQAEYVLTQKFVENSLLLDNRPFTLRVWAVLAGGAPVMRAYLFNGGILPLGGKLPVGSKHSNAPLDAYIVNLFIQNRSAAADPWSVSHFRDHLRKQPHLDGEAAFQRLWTTVQRSVAATLAAAIPSVRQASLQLPYFQSGTIEFFGFDFVVDDSVRPWLLEVNYLPSMARKVIDCVEDATGPAESQATAARHAEACRANAMDSEKESFIVALLKLIAARHSRVKQHATEAAAARAEMSLPAEASENPSASCGISADTLRQVLDAETERLAATDGFVDLTQGLYGALHCMKGDDTSACEASLPPPVHHQVHVRSPSISRKIMTWMLWTLAQSRWLVTRWQSLTGSQQQMPPSMSAYQPLPDDPVIAAWLQLPIQERSTNTTIVLHKLCQLWASKSPPNAGKLSHTEKHFEL